MKTDIECLVFHSLRMFICFQALLKRNADLTPSTQEQAAILALVTKIQGVLDNLSISPGSFDAAVSQNIVIVQRFIAFKNRLL